jgi:hypothetical protein
MALGFAIGTGEGGGGDFLPIVKFDARSGRISKVDRMMGSDPVVTELKAFKAIFDLENIEVGWMLFSAGSAPDLRLVRLGDPWPDQPSPDHKRGARIVLKLSQADGGDVREMCGNSASFLRGIDALHNAYEAGAKANPGKLPVVALKDTVAVVSKGKTMSSTNYEPVFEIVGWKERGDFAPNFRGTPATRASELAMRIADDTRHAAIMEAGRKAIAPATGSTPVKAPAPMDEDEFA